MEIGFASTRHCEIRGGPLAFPQALTTFCSQGLQVNLYRLFNNEAYKPDPLEIQWKLTVPGSVAAAEATKTLSGGWKQDPEASALDCFCFMLYSNVM